MSKDFKSSIAYLEIKDSIVHNEISGCYFDLVEVSTGSYELWALEQNHKLFEIAIESENLPSEEEQGDSLLIEDLLKTPKIVRASYSVTFPLSDESGEILNTVVYHKK